MPPIWGSADKYLAAERGSRRRISILQLRLWDVAARLVVTLLGAVLVFTSPEGAADHVVWIMVSGPCDPCGEVSDFGQ